MTDLFPFSIRRGALFALALAVAAACSSPKELSFEEGDYRPADEDPEAIISNMSDYSRSLATVRGKGKALVSEPGNSERVTVLFSSNRDRSLVTVKNSIGIEGGQLLTDGDSLLIYNKVDKYARKVAIEEGNLSRINNLASLNILEMLNFTATAEEVDRVLEDSENWLLVLKSGTRMYVHKDSYRLMQVLQPKSSRLPYSKIVYDGYTGIEEFSLPRRITIFSSDGRSKVSLLIQSLEVNPRLDTLDIAIPDNITLYTR